MSKTAAEVMAEINQAMKFPVLKMASADELRVEYIPTGIIPFDILLGGGLPRGRFTTVVGDFSTIKSLLGLKALAQVQAAGGVGALIDTEHAFDPQWATSLGVDVDSLILQHPETGELAIDTAEALIRSGVDLIVFDSVAAALPESEQKNRLHGESIQPARLAQLMSIAMRKLTAANSRTAILWINQLRMNVGVTFGNPLHATGGKSLPYFSSLIIHIAKTGKLTETRKAWDGSTWIDAKEVVGQKYKVTIEKSKLSAPYRDVHIVWDHRTGSVDEVGYLIASGLESGVITRKGNAGWTYQGKTTMGREKFHAKISKDLDLREALTREVYTFHGLPEPPRPPDDSPRPASSKSAT